MQDEKNQIMVTSIWLKQVRKIEGFIEVKGLEVLEANVNSMISCMGSKDVTNESLTILCAFILKPGAYCIKRFTREKLRLF